MIINLYLKVMQTILMSIGTLLIMFGGMTCDGEGFDIAVRMLWFGLFCVIGGCICGHLKEMR